MANKEPGYVYILTNPSFREDWVKIGMTQNMEERLRTLDTTALPLPFKKYATLKTIKYQVAEKHVHHYIERFTNLRIRDNREFFNVKPEDALSIFMEVAELLDDAEIEVFDDNAQKLINKEMAQKEAKAKKHKSGNDTLEDTNSSDGNAPRLCNQTILPRYFKILHSKLTKETMLELGISEDISDIQDIEVLERLRTKLKEKEKNLKYHNTYSCAIRKLISYLENGYNYQDMVFDAALIGSQPSEETSGSNSHNEGVIAFSQEMKDFGVTCRLDFYPENKRYILKAGSVFKELTTESCSQRVASFRDEIMKDASRSRKEGNGIYTLLEDVELPEKSSSPSGASQFCWGTSRPGPADWIDSEGRKYPTNWWKKN